MPNRLCGAALDRRHIDVAVIGGQVDEAALAVDDVVVVDRRQVIDGYPVQLDFRLQLEPPQQPISIEQKPPAIRSPVGCLQEQGVVGVHQSSRAASDLRDPHL
jgi:hypothetical protein